jgi:hypothetical protein
MKDAGDGYFQKGRTSLCKGKLKKRVTDLCKNWGKINLFKLPSSTEEKIEMHQLHVMQIA